MKTKGRAKTKRESVSVRLPEDQFRALADHAERDRRTVSQVVRIALDELLSRQNGRFSPI